MVLALIAVAMILFFVAAWPGSPSMVLTCIGLGLYMLSQLWPHLPLG